MAVQNEATVHGIAIRILDREKALDFYTEKLGFKNLAEENAEAYLGVHGSKEVRLTLEESPAHRARAVIGASKLHIFGIRLESKEQLLDTLYELVSVDYPIESAFEEEKTCGILLSDPENNRLCLQYTVGEERISPKNCRKVEPKTLLSGYTATRERPLWGSEVRIDFLKLNVPCLRKSIDFYTRAFSFAFDEAGTEAILSKNPPFHFSLTEKKGEDLVGNVDRLWDLEYVELGIPTGKEIQAFEEHLEHVGVPYYVDKKRKVLIIKDPCEIEWWFTMKEASGSNP